MNKTRIGLVIAFAIFVNIVATQPVQADSVLGTVIMHGDAYSITNFAVLKEGKHRITGSVDGKRYVLVSIDCRSSSCEIDFSADNMGGTSVLKIDSDEDGEILVFGPDQYRFDKARMVFIWTRLNKLFPPE